MNAWARAEGDEPRRMASFSTSRSAVGHQPSRTTDWGGAVYKEENEFGERNMREQRAENARAEYERALYERERAV